MVSIKQEKSKLPLSLSAIFKGVSVSLVSIILGSSILGTIYHVTTLAEKTLPLTANGLFYISVFIGSVFTSRETGYKGLMHGVSVALLFFSFSWLITSVFFNVQTVFLTLMQKLLFSSIAGIFGGILGVGLHR